MRWSLLTAPLRQMSPPAHGFLGWFTTPKTASVSRRYRGSIAQVGILLPKVSFSLEFTKLILLSVLAHKIFATAISASLSFPIAYYSFNYWKNFDGIWRIHSQVRFDL